ncbi:MAG: hypothetical protein J1F11_10185 [Oscillospiraceae bacterium]|nr:hypothetical protein [Oscillospiraceae bacterium]
MTKQKEIFMAYIINTRDKLQEDIRQLQQRLRYRNADAVDCLELSLALERLSSFEEFSRSAMAILKLFVPDPVTYVSIDTNYAKYRIELERNKGK